MSGQSFKGFRITSNPTFDFNALITRTKSNASKSSIIFPDRCLPTLSDDPLDPLYVLLNYYNYYIFLKRSEAWCESACKKISWKN